MRMPIQYALSYPERLGRRDPRHGFHRAACSLDFEVPDHDTLPLPGPRLPRPGRRGSWPAVLNAANEEAVAAFLDDRIPFIAIPESIDEVIRAESPRPVARLDDVLEADRYARRPPRPRSRGGPPP